MSKELDAYDLYKEAFPSHLEEYRGMTLRDYFAAAALTTIITMDEDLNSAAEWSYEVADAMMKARKK